MDKTSSQSPENIRRRQLIASTAVVAAGLAASSAVAGEHKHHNHHSSMHNDLIDNALDCIKTGEACNHHCLMLIKDGDNSIAECMNIVSQMLPMCKTLASLASAQSKHLYAFAQVCAAVCRDCEEECKAHADMHAQCKECMESCSVCIKECEKLTA